MKGEPPGGGVCRLLSHEDGLFRLTLSITEEKLESAPLILPEGFAAVAAAVFRDASAGIGRAPWDFSILLCDDGLIRRLNRQFRGVDAPTDVLSFEIAGECEDEAGRAFFCAGEIIISLDSLAFNSDEFRVSKNEELKRLVIHGILHLNGMDHCGSSPDQEMLQVQESILKALGAVTLLKEE